jgi:HEAT repeat protein
MKPKLLAVVLLATLCSGRPAPARDEWFRGLDLEAGVAGADLILVARVADVSEMKMTFGGKAERATQQFKFQPVRTLKGVFARDELLLTTDDLGDWEERATRLERGQLRLLLLGRSGIGYANQNRQQTLDQSLSPLRDEADPLWPAVEVLIAVTQEHDRARKVTLLADGLRAAKGSSAVPLLAALQHRALLAAQLPGPAAAVTKHLGDESPAVREAGTRALEALLRADYLEHADLRTAAVGALAAALEQKDTDLGARVAALDALGAAGSAALQSAAAARQLQLDRPRQTFAERAALFRAVGALKGPAPGPAVADVLEQLPLDAPPEVQHDALLALMHLDAERAVKALRSRLEAKFAAGLDLQTEIALLGELPAAAAVPALLDTAKLALNHAERVTLAAACARFADARLVPLLATMLDPRYPDLRWQAVEGLRKTDTAEAAKALQPHLREEADLARKLQIAEFLGRHGIRDGYPYALEHMSEPGLLEGAVAALAAIRDPKAVPALRDILKTSNNTAWNGAAVRALGALGAKEFAPQFLDSVADLRRPLAPYALVALGDLGESKALPRVREGLKSRNDHIVLASVRAAAKLIPLSDAKTDDLRDTLAALLADADAALVLRLAALDALVTLKDDRLDRALTQAVRDAGLEGGSLVLLLQRTETLLRERNVKLMLP